MIDAKIKKNCTGCYACYNICPQNCISMANDNEGFWYPKVDSDKCVKCNLCINVCPIITKAEIQKNDIKAYACINKNESIRLESSSGGFFTLLAEHILDKGGIVFGARFDDDFSVVHGYAETKEELKNFRGSKYVQSKIGDAYKQVQSFLEEGREVLFTGTPCQIAGLKRYLNEDYVNLICQDVICQGVPSPLVWQSYLKCRIEGEGKGSQIKNISFRSKDESWKRYKIKIHFESGEVYQKSKSNDNYLKAFMKFLSIRPSCFECNFKGEGRESDITLADFWGIEKIEPTMNDDKGTSLILINTLKGQKILDELKEKIIYQEVRFIDSVKSNPMYYKSIPSNNYNSRSNFLKELRSSDFDTVAKKYLKEPISSVLFGKLKRIYIKLMHKVKG